MVLHLYVLRQLLISTGFALGGIAMLVLPTAAIKAVHELGGVSIVAVFQFMPLVLVELVPYLLPLGFLLGVVATYGRLASDRELIAVRMAGFHPARLLIPGVLLGAPLALGTGQLLTTVAPEWKFQKRNFYREAQENAFRTLSHTRGEIDYGAFSLRYEYPDGNRFYEAILNIPREGRDDLTVVADWVELGFDDEALVVSLAGAQILSDVGEFESESPVVRLSLEELFSTGTRERTRLKYRSNAEIYHDLDTKELTEEERDQHLYFINERYALSMTYLVFLLLGVPTGILLRSGTQLGSFSIAIGYAFGYYLLSMRLGKELASAGVVPPMVAAWSTNALFTVIGAVLSYRALLK